MASEMAGARRVFLRPSQSHGESVFPEVGVARSFLRTAALFLGIGNAAALLAQLACGEEKMVLRFY